MSAAPDSVDPAEAMLAELAGLDLTLARHVHACAMATVDTEEVAELSRAYHRVSRSMRQSLALLARLKQGRLAAEKADRPARPPTDWVRVRRRQGEVRAAVCRVVWDETESESEDEEILLADLEHALRLGEREPSFGMEPLDAQVIEVCAMLDLPLDKAEAWRDLPDLSAERRQRPSDELIADDEDEEAPAWRSSA